MECREPGLTPEILSILQIPEDEFNQAVQEDFDAHAEEEKFWEDNFYLLIKYKDEIKDNPYYYFSRLKHSGVSSAYISFGFLYLGILVELWEQGDWIAECPECGEKLYFTYFAGSPLSGSRHYFGFCPSCHHKYRSSYLKDLKSNTMPHSFLKYGKVWEQLFEQAQARFTDVLEGQKEHITIGLPWRQVLEELRKLEEK